MKTKVTYYKGNLRCQFTTVDPRKLGGTQFQQSFIELEPRFRMYDVEKLDESGYPNENFLQTKPYITSKKKNEIEFHFLGEVIEENKSILKTAEEVILILRNDDSPETAADQATEAGKFPFGSYLKNEENDEKIYSSFQAISGKVSHGKIKGEAYCKVIEYFNEDNKPFTAVQHEELREVERLEKIAASPLGKLGTFTGIVLVGDSKMGCFGKSSAGSNSIAGLPGSIIGNSGGCFGPQAGGVATPGCFNFGRGSGGCLLPLMLLLLAGLLYWLLNQQGCNKTTTAPIIIHDTVKVEVIKERIDTLTIIKTDTLSYVDSTTKVNYETVSLPNVQYYTNSDILLPSSAGDLQKLAEYLTKNDSLSATIYGHTDNVGKAESNMKLSQRRAESVKRFLTSLGIDEKRLTATGMGDKEPKGDNNTEEGRLMNRRVEVKLTNTEISTTTRIKTDSNKKTEEKINEK